MPVFKRKSSVKVVQPINMFEQLEERIVFDATVDPIADQAVNEDATLNVDAHCPAEDTNDVTYGLEVDDGSGGGYEDVATYNANNDPSDADILFDSFTGVITWTPTDSDVGAYSFRIAATDTGTGVPPLFDDEVFTVTVNNLIDFTSANSTTVVEDSALLYNVQTDSEDLGDSVTYSLLAGSPTWVSIDSSTGVLTGNPDNTHVENSPYTFTIQAQVGADIATQTFTLTVNNDPPAFLNVETDIYMTETSGDQTFDVQVDDEGFPPPSGMPGYSITDYDGGGAGGIPGWLTIDSITGVITGNPLDADVGDHTVEVTFDDGNGGVDTQIFDLHVGNQTHFFTSANGTIWTEDVVGPTFNVQTNEEGNGIVTYSFDAAGTVFQYGGWLNIDPNTGVLSPVGALDNSYVGDHTFTIYAQEGHGEAPITQDFTLTVINDWPEITSPATVTVVEDSGGATFQVEVDGGAGASVEVGATFSLIYPPSYGDPTVQVTIDPNTGVITIPDPVNADVGSFDPFVIRVDDGHGGIATQLFNIDIANDVPEWMNPEYALFGGAFTIDAFEDAVATFDFNTDDEGSGPGTYWITGGTDSMSIDANGVLTISGRNADVGNYNVTVWFDDGNSGVISWSCWVNVANVGPVITSADNTTWTEDGGYQSFNINSDDEGEGLTYTIDWDTGTPGVQAPPSWFNYNTTTGLFWGVPTNAQAGVWTFDIIADDGYDTTTQTFTLTVDNIPAEFVTDDHVYFDLNGGSQSFDVHTTDENYDGGGNQYVLIDTGSGIPSGVTIDSKTGVITWDGTGLGPGDYSFEVGFFDGIEWIIPGQPFTLHIYDDTYMGGNIWGQPGFDDYQYGFYSINNHTMLEDEGVQVFDVEYMNEGDAGVTYSLDGAEPFGLTIDANTGEITWDPTNEDVTIPRDGNPYVFNVLVDDTINGNGIIVHEFTLDVENVIPWYTTAPSTSWTEDQAGQTYDIHNTDEGDGGTTYAFQQDGNVTWDAQYYYWCGWLRIDISTGVLSMNPLDPTVDDTTPVPTNFHVGTHNFTVLVDDQHGDPAEPNFPVELNFTLEIGNTLDITNDPADFIVTWQEDDNTGSINVDVNSTDENYMVDGAPNNDVTYSLSNLPDWLVGNISIDPTTGVITTTPGIMPDNTDVGSNTFTISVTDGHDTVSETFTIQVANRDPVFDPAVDYTDLHMTEDASNIIDLQVDDEGQGRVIYAWDPATVALVPQWMSLDPYTGEITGSPTNQHADDTYTFNVIAYDFNEAHQYGYPGIDGQTTQTLTIIVDNVPPTFSSPNADSVDEDSSWTFNVQTDDEGVGGTQYSLAPGAPAWIDIDPDTGVMTANPTNAEVGVHTFDIQVDDTNTGGLVTQTFTLAVNNVDPEFLTPQPPGGGGNPSYTLTLTEDTTGNYYDLMTNDDGQHNTYAGTQVIYSLDPATAPPGVRFANGFAGAAQDAYGFLESLDGLLTMSPTNSDVGTNVFQITLDDGNGGTAVMDFTLIVTNTTPEFTTPNAVVWWEDDTTEVPFDVSTTDEPHDHWVGPPTHDYNEYTLIGAPSWLVIDQTDGVMRINNTDTANLDGSPDNHLVGTYNFTIRFYDGDVYIDQPFSLTVNNAATDIDTPISDVYITQDQNIHLNDADVNAIDEYHDPQVDPVAYDQDRYELYILVDNQGSWIRVDDGTYNTDNDAWNGADISFDTETGEFDWTPNNADVPNDPADGLYHTFRVVHYDHYGETFTTFDEEFFRVYVENVPPTLPQAPPTDIPNWELREDTPWSRIDGPGGTEYANWIYPEDLVNSNEEGVGVTYNLWIDGTLWTPGYRPNGPEGGEVIFDEDTGEILWETTNADVTTEIDGDPVRPLYNFEIQADDGNAMANPGGNNLSPRRSFTVQVWNTPTDITAYPAGGTITEDSNFSFNIQAIDEETERPVGDPAWRNTYYELTVDDGSGTVDWTVYNGANGVRADISFNEDTGQFGWDPNHADLLWGSNYTFTVTHYDGHDTFDTETFVYTVVNNPPETNEPVQWILTEDESAANSTLDIDSDDDPYTTVTFDLRISTDGGSSWVPWFSGYRPNGPDGGEIIFDSNTGVIIWQTTNEDVTFDVNGNPTQPYIFQVQADDGEPGGLSAWADGEFEVVVLNANTAFTTDVLDQTLQEDVLFELTDAEANTIDEYPGQVGYPPDDYYRLWIDWEDQSASGGWVDVTTFNTINDAWNGADIIFDTKTGALQWTPNNADEPNDLNWNGTEYQHEFRIEHIDAHGSTANDYFFVRFDNIAPTLDPLEPWELWEDTAQSRVGGGAGMPYSDWIYPEGYVDSDEEGFGVTYELQVSLDNGSTWTSWTAGYRPNGPDGGAIQFDVNDGGILWETTNADVTVGVPGRTPYVFRIQADDGNPSNNLSGWQEFNVTVYNDPTLITDSPADQTITEDSTFTYNIEARDEEIERPAPAAIDTYYTLDVSTDGGGTWVPYATLPGNYNDNNGLRADVIFDRDTGDFEWTPNHDDTEAGALDFRVTHYDAHGSFDVETFRLTVDNRPSDVTNEPVTWNLIEDTPDTLDLDSDDDPYTNVTYELRVSTDGGTSWSGVWVSGDRVNGPDGGQLFIDAATGEITWQTTNEDVTIDTGGAQYRVPYVFQVRTNDGIGDSAWADCQFNVDVQNTTTDITTDIGSSGYLSVTEDNLFQITDGEVVSIDEYDDYLPTYTAEDYYELYIDWENQGVWTRVDDGTFNTLNNAWNGADIAFDTKTGAISWTPNNADVPNTLDGDTEFKHEFRIVHYDDHNTSDDDYFYLEVINTPPTLDPIPDWQLTEDDAVVNPGNPDLWTFDESNVNSDEEGYGVTYELQISLDGGATWTTWTAGYRPNGPDGGEIIFNEDNGEIQWATSNADVTHDVLGNPLAGLNDYVFRIQADDNNPVNNLSAWDEFNVEVRNHPTDITSPSDQTIVEDNPITTIDWDARDEEVESTDPGYLRDTYYTLEIDKDNDGSWETLAVYNAGNGVGADFVFNADTGVLDWTPNNADVGVYNLRATHYDGHGSTAVDEVLLTVNSAPPVMTNPVLWENVEDSTNPAVYTLNIESDDEYDGGVTYELQVSQDGSGTDYVTWTAGYRPNGLYGGEILFNTTTGVIQWQTTNEDTTLNQSGAADRVPYLFRVQATDAWGVSSAWADCTFDVTVANDPTDITTDVPDQTIQEDSTFTITDAEVDAIDEYYDNGAFTADDYYELYIDWENANATGGWIRVDGGAGSAFNTMNDAWGGADIFFDTKTGAITWTPNNADVPDTLDWTGAAYRHQFSIVHYDAHGTSDEDFFFLTIENREPTLPAIPDWQLTEDDGAEHPGEDWRWTMDESLVNSDDEGLDGTTYTLEVSLDGGTTWTTWSAGYRPNGPDGGEIVFDNTNGEIQWETTNADVTHDVSGGALAGLNPYVFRIQANDQNPYPVNTNLSGWQEFNVEVRNHPTDITSPADQTIAEDTPIATIDWDARDEEVESTDPAYLRDTYYTLEIDKDNDGTWETLAAYNAGNGVGADFVFDADTGALDWTPNNADVGVYNLRATHYDGHGSTAVDEVLLTVTNTAPVMTNPVLWANVEDSTDPAVYTLNIESDDEADGGVTYELQVSQDGSGTDYVTWTAGYRPNGLYGGEIIFNTTTGVIEWQTTNEDTTLNQSGAADRVPYLFRVQATDAWGVSSAWADCTFDVTVANDPTDITTDIVSRTVQEDSLFQITNAEVVAIDEYYDNGLFTADDYYELYIDWENQNAVGGWIRVDGGATSPYNTWNNTFGGADISFDTKTGEISWTPNNADVPDTLDYTGTAYRHEFRIIHYDSHGTTDIDDFFLTVENREPTLPAIPTWQLVEDDGVEHPAEPWRWTMDESLVNSDDEGLDGTTYTLEISLDGGTTWTTWSSVYRPNGADGGEIVFNNATGEIQWETTNADVTHDVAGGALAGLNPYVFRIQANDQNPYPVNTNLSVWQEFNVEVRNHPTDITSPADQTIAEDTPITTIDWDARDEEVESTDPGYLRDTYYTLEIDKDNDGSWETLAAYNAGNGVGADFVFDADTGVLDWTPNNADVGVYNLRATHYDGHGSTAVDEVLLTVTNTPPNMTNPVLWENVEDSTDPAVYTLNIESDDEYDGGVTYELQVSQDGSGTDYVTWTAGYRPNGPDGGVILFDTSTGAIQWQTTNEDTTLNQSGAADRVPYLFRVRAQDASGAWSAWSDCTFDVTVANTPTDITTDIGDITMQEDQLLAIPDAAVQAVDEYFGNLTFPADDYYELYIDWENQGTWTRVDDGTFNTLNDAWNGADITFDTKTGALQWQPNNADVPDTADGGGFYRHEFRIVHYDNHGTQDEDLFFLTVENRTTTLDPILEWVLTEDDAVVNPGNPTLWTLDESVVDCDDEGLGGTTYNLEVSLNGGTTWTTWSAGYRPNGPDGGEIVFNNTNGEIQWQTTNADVTVGVPGRPDYIFRIQADDQNPYPAATNLSSWEYFDVRVVNAPTSITDHPADQTVVEDTLFTYDIEARDEEIQRGGLYPLDTYYDLEVNDGTGYVDFLTYNAGNGARADIIFDTDTGLFQWTPNNADRLVETYNFLVTHHDANGSQHTEHFMFTVGNTPPVFTDFPTTWNLTEDDAVNNPSNPALWTLGDSEIQATDEGFGLTYSLEIDGVLWTPGYRPNGPDGGEVIFDTLTGEIIWATTNADVTNLLGGPSGSARPAYVFTVTGDDHSGGTVTDSFDVFVANDPTDITVYPPSQIVLEDTTFVFDVQARDEEVQRGGPFSNDTFYTLEVDRLGDPIGYQFVDVYNANNGPGADIIFNRDTGQISWSVGNADAIGDYNFRVTHNDSFNSADSETFTLTIVNTPPVFTTSPPPGDPVVVMESTYLTYDADSTDEGQHDWRGDDNVEYSILVGPPGLDIDPNTGLIHWLAPGALAGYHSVLIQVHDGNGGFDLQGFELLIDVHINPNIPEDPDLKVELEKPEPGPGPKYHDPVLPDDRPNDERPEPEWPKPFKRPAEKIAEVFSLIFDKFFKQPEQEISGSVAPITPLEGFLPQVQAGKRLDFDADLTTLWNRQGFVQPSLRIAGSQDPTTPLEGFAHQVDTGKQLDFDFYPIKQAQAFDEHSGEVELAQGDTGNHLDPGFSPIEDTVAFDLEDLTVAQLLEVG